MMEIEMIDTDLAELSQKPATQQTTEMIDMLLDARNAWGNMEEYQSISRPFDTVKGGDVSRTKPQVI